MVVFAAMRHNFMAVMSSGDTIRIGMPWRVDVLRTEGQDTRKRCLFCLTQTAWQCTMLPLGLLRIPPTQRRGRDKPATLSQYCLCPTARLATVMQHVPSTLICKAIARLDSSLDPFPHGHLRDAHLSSLLAAMVTSCLLTLLKAAESLRHPLHIVRPALPFILLSAP